MYFSTHFHWEVRERAQMQKHDPAASHRDLMHSKCDAATKSQLA